MAKISRLEIAYSRTFDLGHGFAKLGITIEAELDQEDDRAQVERELWSEAVSQVKAQALPLIANKRNKVESAFLALPESVQNEVMERLYNGDGETDPDPFGNGGDHFLNKP